MNNYTERMSVYAEIHRLQESGVLGEEYLPEPKFQSWKILKSAEVPAELLAKQGVEVFEESLVVWVN